MDIAQRVVVGPASAHAAEGTGAEARWPYEACTLPHPRTGEAVAWLRHTHTLLEVNEHRPSHAAWFAGNSVCSDGALYLCTPVDPLFLLLTVLTCNSQQGAEGLFRSAEDLLQECRPALCSALGPDPAACLRCLCDCKDAGGEAFFRLSQPRVVAWLRVKARRVAQALAASSPAFADMGPPALLAYSVGLVGEYLAPAWLERLQAACDLPTAGGEGYQPLATVDAAAGRQGEKRPRLDPKAIARERAKVAKTEAKAQKLAKEAATMHKLTGFFRPVRTAS